MRDDICRMTDKSGSSPVNEKHFGKESKK